MSLRFARLCAATAAVVALTAAVVALAACEPAAPNEPGITPSAPASVSAGPEPSPPSPLPSEIIEACGLPPGATVLPSSCPGLLGPDDIGVPGPAAVFEQMVTGRARAAAVS
ncbi:hypothetical protein [Actinoplanes utahensis]|uniref:Uncharacterized protein n=1 Tax=Actinoplanes utahensis TaxID=1869 RepID=A0A0A6UEQ2_ACTUT|nr:hypothetical protein [Actinoplanes utahensis]KHD73563.1 hypothetical protein MB27_34120 [Actinoplanes utahensis]